MPRATISLTAEAVQTAFRSFILSVLPDISVILGQVNRVPEPRTADFCVYWPLRQDRLATNILEYLDALAIGSTVGTVLTVTEVSQGVLLPGTLLTGEADDTFAPNTVIVSQLTGPTGGVGTYRITPSQTVSSVNIRAGVRYDTQPTQLDVQIDVHGPNSWDNTEIIGTLFKSIYSTEQIVGLEMSPLFSTAPRQVPFINAEQQYEDRWVIEASFQLNPKVGTPQQFADQLEITLIDTLTTYPA